MTTSRLIIPHQTGGGLLAVRSTRAQHPRQYGGANCGTQYPVWRGELPQRWYP
jgi:hypothetical protein